MLAKDPPFGYDSFEEISGFKQAQDDFINTFGDSGLAMKDLTDNTAEVAKFVESLPSDLKHDLFLKE